MSEQKKQNEGMTHSVVSEWQIIRDQATGLINGYGDIEAAYNYLESNLDKHPKVDKLIKNARWLVFSITSSSSGDCILDAAKELNSALAALEQEKV